MDNLNDQAQKIEDLKWSLEMYKLYLRQTVVALKEYNEGINNMKEVIETIPSIADNLNSTLDSYKFE